MQQIYEMELRIFGLLNLVSISLLLVIPLLLVIDFWVNTRKLK